MTTTAPDVTAPADASAADYAATLHRIADSIAAAAIVRPRMPLRLYLTSYFGDTDEGKTAFRAARCAFPDATVETKDNYVELHIGEHALLLFDKAALGTQTTVTREVVEYLIDPALLAPVST